MYYEVADAGNMKPCEGRTIKINDNDIALFNLNGEFFAIQNTCPHRGGPLGEGSLDEDGVVICPWHGYSFNVKTGEPYGFPYPVKTFPVKIENGKVFVNVE